MPAIPPVQNLDTCASRMVSSVVRNNPAQKIYVRNFLREANMSGQQGNALVSYYTVFNKYLDSTNKLANGVIERIENLPSLISKIAYGTPAIEQEARTFVKALRSKYPQTLAKRISLASQGAVSADKVEPTSRFKKFMVFLNRFMDTSDC